MKKILIFLALLIANVAWADYRYGWYTDGSCSEQTPDGYLVQYVDKSFCENQ